MLPTIEIFGKTIDLYLFNLAFTVIMFFVIGFIYALINKIKLSKTMALLFCLLFVGYLGGKLLFNIENSSWDFNIANFYINGAIILIPFSTILFSKLFKLDLIKTLSLTAILSAFFCAQTKVGCFLAGCCGGYPSDFGFYFVNEPTIKIFPIQLVQFILYYIVLVVIIFITKNKKLEHYAFPAYLVLYDIALIFTEIYVDNPKYIAGLTIAQMIAIAYCLVGFIWIFIINKKKEVNNL